VISFAGTTTGHPQALRQDEVDRILGRVEERRFVTTVEATFREGDPVKVIDGPFKDCNATVREVNVQKQKLKVEVGILGRKTPIELDFNQVEIENH
jgi:transcriptional antiterminator NusG